MADTPPYWLVWRENGAAPTKQHPGPVEAEQEAKRLAELNRGEAFVVLCPIARVMVPTPIVIERFDAGDDGIPF